MEVRGKLTQKVGERKGVAQNGTEWRRAEFLVEVPGRFPTKIVFSVRNVQNRIERFESLIGKDVEVSFDINAREYQGRWFNDVEAWGILNLEDIKSAGQQTQQSGDKLPFE